MPSAPKDSSAPVLLVCGEDDFAVKRRAREAHSQWCGEGGGFDHDTIDAGAANAGEALRAIGRLHEALQTLPFFGGSKVVWFQGCNFLDDDRTARAAAVSAALGGLAQTLKAFRWDGVRLLVSAGKVDKRKSLYKTLEKLGTVEEFKPLSLEDRDWAAKVEAAALRKARELRKELDDDALGALVNLVGPNLHQLESEVEKLASFAGARPGITRADVESVVSRNKQARAFALADAVGDRDLPRVLRTLDGELWAMQSDRERSEIGLLYGILSKVRAMLLAREMAAAGWLDLAMDFSDRGAFDQFKRQLGRAPADAFPADRKFNPQAMHPFMFFNAFKQCRNYTSAELVRAMELLLDCNRRLVGSSTDPALVLQHTLAQIARREAA
jgi:DNA polymerase-3 subunit delta